MSRFWSSSEGARWPASAIVTLRAAVVAVGLAVIAHVASAQAQTTQDPALDVEEVASGLALPTAMAFIGPSDILVLEKATGRVRRVTGGVLQSGFVLDVGVDFASERGLLGIALHPGFPGQPFVYLYYTQSGNGGDTNGAPAAIGNRVYRYTWNGSALVSPLLIASLPVTPGPNHDGGKILFGPDGKLYVVIGDLNRNGQLQNFPSGPAPDDTGVILRLNADGSVPSDNPFAAQGGNLAKYFAYGIRNSFGMAFDPVTGNLWMTENGENTYDEINLFPPGANSGWEQIMGPDARDPQGVANLFAVPGSTYVDPKFSWFDTVAPTAIAFLPTASLGAQYQGNAFVGDINNGRIYRFRLNSARNGFVFSDPDLADRVADSDAELDEVLFATGFSGVTDLKVGPDGLLYVLSFGGTIHVIRPGTAPATVSLAFLGTQRDRVGRAATALNPDGLLDGTFTVALGAGSGPRTVTALELRRTDNSGVWDTVVGPYWILGAAQTLDGPLLNAGNGTVSFAVADGGSFTIFAADTASRIFTAGAAFRVTVWFAGGATATATTVVGGGAVPTVSLAFLGKPVDRVGRGATALNPDGQPDGTFTVGLAAGSGTRTVTAIDLRLTNNSGVWDTFVGGPYWILGAANTPTGTLYNAANGSVSFAVAGGGSFSIFAADTASGIFRPGFAFRVTVSFADGATATATTTIGSP